MTLIHKWFFQFARKNILLTIQKPKYFSGWYKYASGPKYSKSVTDKREILCISTRCDSTFPENIKCPVASAAASQLRLPGQKPAGKKCSLFRRLSLLHFSLRDVAHEWLVGIISVTLPQYTVRKSYDYNCCECNMVTVTPPTRVNKRKLCGHNKVNAAWN